MNFAWSTRPPAHGENKPIRWASSGWVRGGSRARPFRDQQRIVTLGVNRDGRQTVWGLREGTRDNATVVRALLRDLAGRGLDFSVPRL
jgi:transposase-like protein